MTDPEHTHHLCVWAIRLVEDSGDDAAWERHVEELSRFLEMHLPDVDWDGDEGGINLLLGDSEEGHLRLPQGSWLLVPMKNTFFSLTDEQMEAAQPPGARPRS